MVELKLKRNLGFLVLTAVLTLALGSVQVSAEQATVTFTPSSVKDVPSGEFFSIDVTITNVANLYGWQANITFSPSVLSVENVTEGPFLQGFYETVWTKVIYNDFGYVQFQASYYPPYTDKLGANGTGVLATITFEVKSGGSSALDLAEGTKLKSFKGGTLVDIEDFEAQDGSFTGTGGGVFTLPLEIIAGAGAVVLIVVVVGVFFFMKKRKE